MQIKDLLSKEHYDYTTTKSLLLYYYKIHKFLMKSSAYPLL